jgi:hypothetical protein
LLFPFVQALRPGPLESGEFLVLMPLLGFEGLVGARMLAPLAMGERSAVG